MEEEGDSDLETTRVAVAASGTPVVNSSVDMLDTDVSQRQGSHLDKVNFTWLQDYFASSWALSVIFESVNQIMEFFNVQFELTSIQAFSSR